MLDAYLVSHTHFPLLVVIMFANAFLDRLLLLILKGFARFAILELNIQHLNLSLIGSFDHDSETTCTWIAKLLSNWICLDF